jgi:L-alanine-DL-glutamate epimerase-like enolase superfamily enzyme
LGWTINTPDDIRRLTYEVRRQSFDLLQADHTLSGVDMALWDLLGKQRGEPTWRLLGWEKAYPKQAYASQLFGDTPETTFSLAQKVHAQGFTAAKFGWGPFGQDLAADEAHIRAAREGLGDDVRLLVDAGTIWGDDVEQAALRLPVLHECDVLWLEEPFVSGALHAYANLSERMRAPLRTAAGEGSHEPHMARNLIDFGRVGYIQIDAGRIGGLTSAYEIARYAEAKNVTYVNHTFTTPLALSASLQPFAGLKDHPLCEFPTQGSALAQTLTTGGPKPTVNGAIHLSDRPGLGVTINFQTLREYAIDAKILVSGQMLYKTPNI